MRFLLLLFILGFAIVPAYDVFAFLNAGDDGDVFNVRNVHMRPATGGTRYLMQYLKDDPITGDSGGIRLCNGFDTGSTIPTCASTETGAVPGFLLDIQGTANISDGVFGLGAGLIRYNAGALELSADGGSTWGAIGGGDESAATAGGWELQNFAPQPDTLTTIANNPHRVGINVGSTDQNLSTFTVRQGEWFRASGQVDSAGGTAIVPRSGTNFVPEIRIGDKIEVVNVGQVTPIIATAVVTDVTASSVTVNQSLASFLSKELLVTPSIMRIEDASGNPLFQILGDGSFVGGPTSQWQNVTGGIHYNAGDVGIGIDPANPANVSSASLFVNSDSVFFAKLAVGPTASVSGTDSDASIKIRGLLDASAGSATLTTQDINGDFIPERFIVSTEFEVGDAIGFATSGTGPIIHRTTIIFKDASNRAVLESAGSLSDGSYSVFKDSRLFDVRNGADRSRVVINKTGNVGIGTANPNYKLEVVKSNPSSLGEIARFYHGPASDRSFEIGVNGTSPFPVYIQSRNSGNTAGILSINPNGGNVGIGTTNPGAKLEIVGGGSDQYPNGNMKITNRAIMFGGINNGYEGNSGQISAGMHVPNSLNIVGIGTAGNNRRIDMWAEGGLTVNGAVTIGNGLTVSNEGGAHSNIILRDDESPNGVKYVHANSNNIGFLSGAGAWIARWDNSGNMVNSGAVTIGGYISAPTVYGGSSYIQGTGGRNMFNDSENAGYLRVGAAWGIPGIYAEGNKSLVLGAGSGYVYIGYSTANSLRVTGSITATGGVTASAFYYSSDQSLKKDIQPLTYNLEKIKQLQGVSFAWKKDGTKSIGLIAQDVEKVFPELVSTDKETGLKSLQYANFVALLIEAVKEQQMQIETLKLEVAELKRQ